MRSQSLSEWQGEDVVGGGRLGVEGSMQGRGRVCSDQLAAPHLKSIVGLAGSFFVFVMHLTESSGADPVVCRAAKVA